jgi:translation initiation factor 4A
VYNIFQLLNTNIQVALFTATLPNNIYNITTKFMRDPVKICVKSESLTLEGIKQYFVAINNDNEKYLTLKNIYSFISLSQCIIYCNSVNRVIKLYEEMIADGFPVTFIHSNMDKCKREESFKEFKSGSSRVLISTDITSRGIDIQQVSVVINFDLPKCVHKYLHRIGRSGRWGRKGVGINLVSRYDIDNLRTIEKHYSCEIQEMPMNYDCV